MAPSGGDHLPADDGPPKPVFTGFVGLQGCTAGGRTSDGPQFGAPLWSHLWSHRALAVFAAQVGENLEIEHPAVVYPVVVVLAAQEEFPPPTGGRVPIVIRFPLIEAL